MSVAQTSFVCRPNVLTCRPIVLSIKRLHTEKHPATPHPIQMICDSRPCDLAYSTSGDAISFVRRSTIISIYSHSAYHNCKRNSPYPAEEKALLPLQHLTNNQVNSVHIPTSSVSHVFVVCKIYKNRI